MRHWQDNAIYSVLSIVLFSLFSQMCCANQNKFLESVGWSFSPLLCFPRS